MTMRLGSTASTLPVCCEPLRDRGDIPLGDTEPLSEFARRQPFVIIWRAAIGLGIDQLLKRAFRRCRPLEHELQVLERHLI